MRRCRKHTSVAFLVGAAALLAGCGSAEQLDTSVGSYGGADAASSGIPDAEAQPCRVGFLPEYPTGGFNYDPSINVLDLNGDGFDDVLIGQPFVRVMLSTGGSAAGMLLAPVEYGAVQQTLPAELNGDGRPDLVVALTQEIRALINAGDGTFAEGAASPQPADFYRMVGIGDMDHDGYADIVVRTSSAIVLLRGTEDGQFVQDPEPLVDHALANGVALGDLDTDGWLDVVNVHYPDVNAYLNDRKGRLKPVIVSSVGASSSSVMIADLSRDGIPDLVLENGGAMMSGGPVKVSPGLGNGVFGAPITWHEAEARAAVVGDLDGDGWPDLAAGGVTINVVLNSGQGTPGEMFSFPEQFASIPEAMGIGDLNHDGRLDLVVAHRKWDKLSVLVNWCED